MSILKFGNFLLSLLSLVFSFQLEVKCMQTLLRILVPSDEIGFGVSISLYSHGFVDKLELH